MNFKQYKDKLLQVLNIYLWTFVIISVIYTTVVFVGYVSQNRLAIIKSTDAVVTSPIAR